MCIQRIRSKQFQAVNKFLLGAKITSDLPLKTQGLLIDPSLLANYFARLVMICHYISRVKYLPYDIPVIMIIMI